jgi:hypothetical protein
MAERQLQLPLPEVRAREFAGSGASRVLYFIAQREPSREPQYQSSSEPSK